MAVGLSVGAVTGQVQSTFLFQNLEFFGTRLPAGDPDLTVTNVHGQIEDGPKDIAVADVNGDLRPDIGIANKDGTVTLYLATGDFTFGDPVHWRTQGTELRGIVMVDLTGDARRDIAVGAPFDGAVYLFVNQGEGVMADPVSIGTWVGARDLAAGDFDGDGLLDLAVGGTTNGVAHYRNLGGGTFELQASIPEIGDAEAELPPQPAFYLKAFRLPGATRDLLVAARAQTNALWVLGAADAGPLAVQGVLTNIGVNALDVGPLLRPAAQGVPDLVVADNNTGFLKIHSSISTSSRFNSEPAQTLGVAGGPRNVRITDLDGDGWNDLVVVQQNFNKVIAFRNLGGVLTAYAESPVGVRPREMALGDFNGDGHEDAAVLNRESQDVSILRAYPGTAGFASVGEVYPLDGEVAGVEVRDINEDGLDDVVLIHRSSGEFSVRLMTTNGVLAEPEFYPLGGRPMGQVIVDVNRDHWPDLLTVNFQPYITVQLGLGDGSFGPAEQYGLPDPIPTYGLSPGMPLPGARSAQLFSLEAADFDGDGFVDVAVGFWDCRLGFYRGHGDGTFTFTLAHFLFPEPRGIVAADFDQDDDLDLAVVSLYPQLAVFENPGNLLDAIHPDIEIHDIGVRNAREVTPLQANDDDDPDLLILGDVAELLVGGAGVSFRPETNIMIDIIGGNVSSVVLADLDGDDDTDLASACSDGTCVDVSLFDEDHGFVLFLTAHPPSTRYLAAGDLDGDGLTDLVGSGESLWLALSGSPATHGPPRLVPNPRHSQPSVVINELLALNEDWPVAADGGRASDWLEIFNGTAQPVVLSGWNLMLVRSNWITITAANTPPTTEWVWETNVFAFPQDDALPPGQHRLLVCQKNLRSPYHTGFPLPAEGGWVCLLDPEGNRVDDVLYPVQQADVSWGRFRDGMASFVSCVFPTPGGPNIDGGPVEPDLDFEGVDLAALQEDGSLRFFARAVDDIGVMGVEVVWRRLDVPDAPDQRLILADDGMNGDGAMMDGLYAGALEPPLPPGAEIQFYLECMDVSEIRVREPGNPLFVAPGQPAQTHTLAVGVARPPLEISELVADNDSGLRDEGNGTPDWVEIRNCAAMPVPLDGVQLARKFFGNGSRMTLTNAALGPLEHVVIFADDKPSQGDLHAPFSLEKQGDALVLTGTTPNGARYLIDLVQFEAQRADMAWARLGCRGPWRFAEPTPGGANISGSWDVAVSKNGWFTFGFPTVAGTSYIVEFKASLSDPFWTILPPVAGDGLEGTVTRPMRRQGFFRVRGAP